MFTQCKNFTKWDFVGIKSVKRFEQLKLRQNRGKKLKQYSEHIHMKTCYLENNEYDR